MREFVCSSNEENLTTLYNNAVEVDVAVKAVVNITLTGFVSPSLYSLNNHQLLVEKQTYSHRNIKTSRENTVNRIEL